MSIYNKYKITKVDLLKRNHGIFIESVEDSFLNFISQERKAGNKILSDDYIFSTERKIKRSTYINVFALCILGLFCLFLGLYQFLYTEPLIGVNLYTQFPLISNGSIEIAGSILLLLGSGYSYLKRKDVLERLVKSHLIDALRKLKREKDNLPIAQSKKRKRFKQSYKVGNKKPPK
ncbi:hypothetical protein HNV10_11310 [Winogradskyella litoriviva]|uniref:DUF4231 domain-containing protein n=1 Tax=Winogradskyella litoriviva TaxID=1220182 RepID=A0ABX2E5R9_9FLAO|nr:hypothetical protein [Winogradskyella litoriviva]NRD23834.1 hypothetical protein [Winogradskyella litoriviva]